MKRTENLKEVLSIISYYFSLLDKIEDGCLCICDLTTKINLEGLKLEKSERVVYDAFSNKLYYNKKSSKEDILTAFLIGMFRFLLVDKENFPEPLEDEIMYNINYKYSVLYSELKVLSLLESIPDKFDKEYNEFINGWENHMVMIMNQESNNKILYVEMRKIAKLALENFNLEIL